MDWTSIYRPERKVEWSDIAAEIRETVTMEDVIHAYTPHIKTRNHRCPCPFHNGKDNNFSFTRTGYKCFVCGASGDVIGYVQNILNIPTRTDAMLQINHDLQLNLQLNEPQNEIQSAALALKRKAREEKEKAHAEWEETYHSLWADWIECDKIRMTADPESEEYANAVKRIDHLVYLLDNLPPEPR